METRILGNGLTVSAVGLGWSSEKPLLYDGPAG